MTGEQDPYGWNEDHDDRGQFRNAPLPYQQRYRYPGAPYHLGSPIVAPKSAGLHLLVSFFLVGFLFFPVAFGLWIWSMIDAYQGAQQWNARHGIVS